jgi:hypothetical protein
MINFTSLQGLVDQYPLIAVLIGAVVWVLGWRMYRGFVLVAGALVGALMLPDLLWVVDPSLRLVLAIVGAVAGAFFALFLLPVAMFLLGVYIGAGFANTWLGTGAPLVNLFIGAVVGVAFFVLHMFLIVLVTSLSGSWMMARGLDDLMGLHLDATTLQVAVVLATIAGIALQYRLWGPPKMETRDLMPWQRRKE